MSGILYLCATPIGNLEDITYRVVRILKEVDLIAAEDTRRTRKLLNYLEINTPLTSYYEHNKEVKGPSLIKKLQDGLNIALVTDAGTPGISDPGEDLVKLAHENGIKVTPLPGAVAAISGLIISGISTDRFVFEGFLPTDNKRKKERLHKLSKEERTIILYEAPHRISKTLEALYKTLGNRKISIIRELTKQYEEVKLFTIEEAIKYYKDNSPKGEFVLVVEGISNEEINKINAKKWENINVDEHLKLYLEKGMDKKEAMKQVAKDRGIPKREVYKIIHKKEQ